MSYLTQWRLTYDDPFVSRCRSCLTQQGAEEYAASEDVVDAALADAVLRGEPGPLSAFQSILPTTPGFSDTVDNGDGTIDSSKIDDLEILSGVQAHWRQVADLFFEPDGQAKGAP